MRREYEMCARGSRKRTCRQAGAREIQTHSDMVHTLCIPFGIRVVVHVDSTPFSIEWLSTIFASLSLPLGLSLYECDVYGRWIDVSAAGATKWIFIPFVLLTIRFRLLRIECSNNRISLSTLTAPHTFRGSRFAFFFRCVHSIFAVDFGFIPLPSSNFNSTLIVCHSRFEVAKWHIREALVSHCKDPSLEHI